MCRWAVVMSAPNTDDVLLADIVTRPLRSVIRQSFACQERAKMPQGQLPNAAYQQSTLNGDGYGVGWYMRRQERDPVPCVFVSTKPAWNDINLENLAEKTRSPLIFTHLRAAGPGTPIGENMCHPFRAGCFLWMHNGCLVDWSRTQRRFLGMLDDDSFQLAMLHGGIDSVVAFGLFLTHLTAANPGKHWLDHYSPGELVEAMDQTIGAINSVHRSMGVEGGSLMNFVVADGNVVIATRAMDGGGEAGSSVASDQSSNSGERSTTSPPLPPLLAPADGPQGPRKESYHAAERREAASLYLSTGSRWVCSGQTTAGGDYRMAQHDKSVGKLVISSEPLNEQRQEWVPIPTNHTVVCVPRDRHIDVLSVPIRSATRIPSTAPGFRSVLDLLCLDHTARPHPALPSSPTCETERDVEQPCPASSSQGAVTLCGHTESVTCMLSCCGGRVLVTGAQDGQIRFWSLPLGVCCAERKHAGPVLALARDDGGRGVLLEAEGVQQEVGGMPPLLISSSNNELRIWCMASVYENAQRPDGGGDGAWEVSCLFIIRFTPSQGRLLALWGDAEELWLGFQTGAIVRAQLKPHWDSLRRLQSRSRSMHHRAVNLQEISPLGQETNNPCMSRRFTVERCFSWLSGRARLPGELGAGAGLVDGHFGPVYAFCKASNGELASAGGDGRILLWAVGDGPCSDATPEPLLGHSAAVFTVSAAGRHHIVSGSSDGTIRHWHVASRSCTRTIQQAALQGAVQSVAVVGDWVLLNAGDYCLAAWSLSQPGERNLIDLRTPAGAQSERGPTLIYSVETPHHCRLAIAGADSGVVCLTDAPCGVNPDSPQVIVGEGGPGSFLPSVSVRPMDATTRLMRQLQTLVAMRTVTSDHIQCERAAQWIGARIEAMGATVKLFRGEGENPIVLGRLGFAKDRPTVLLYGHYDVVPPGDDEWCLSNGAALNPWVLATHEGCLYGRGVSDNKGPLLAQLAAVQRLQATGQGRVPCNIFFLYEGDGETSRITHIKAALALARDQGWLDGVAAAVSCNSSWSTDDRPSICVGSRGQIDIEVSVTSPEMGVVPFGTDALSGCNAPVHDILAVCGQLVDAGGLITVPDIYEGVGTLTAADEQAVLEAAKCAEAASVAHLAPGRVPPRADGWQRPAAEVIRRSWHEPALSVANVRVVEGRQAGTGGECRRSGAQKAFATVTLRTVPRQSAEVCVKRLESHLRHEFARRRSPNQMALRCVQMHPWWQFGEDTGLITAAEAALRGVWGCEPLRVREGASLRVLPLLQSTLDVPCLLLPLGQASDGAHLPNERMRSQNLLRGVDVIAALLSRLGSDESPSRQARPCQELGSG
eukprot:Hpha_TRINITY_DN15447_c0_g4::TRINITY_DN15447_c0_g4_i1::g.175383::m.175383/K14262/DUG2; di- and tripeptidase